MAIFYTKNTSYNSSLFHIIEVVPCDEKNVESAGLYNINLIDLNLEEEKRKFTLFTGIKQQCDELHDYITNFWYSQSKKPLPNPRPFTINEIKDQFDEIVFGDHESGEFGLYKLTGHVVLLVNSQNGELSEESERIRYGVSFKQDKKDLLEVMKPLINPYIFIDFESYINGNIDLDEMKNRMKKKTGTGGLYRIPPDHDPSKNWSRISEDEEQAQLEIHESE